MQIIKCPNCGCGVVNQISNDKYECLGCDNSFSIQNLSKEFKRTEEHITEIHKDLKEAIARNENKQGIIAEENLLKRALLCIEDENFGKAEEILEQALDINPENAEIYALKLLAELSTKEVSDISKDYKLVLKNSNFMKMLRFSGSSNSELIEYITNTIFEKLVSEYENIKGNKREIENLLDVFQMFGEFKETERILEDLKKRYEDIGEKEKENKYIVACSKMSDKTATLEDLKYSIEVFQSLGNYKESYSKISFCEERIATKNKKRKKVTAVICAISVIGCIIGVFINAVIVPRNNYLQATVAEEQGMFYEAMKHYEDAGDYKDSKVKKEELRILIDNKYYTAKEYYKLGNMVEAYNIFLTLGSYQDSYSMLNEIRNHLETVYNEAIKAYNEKNGIRASSLFASIKGYKDSQNYLDKCFDCDYIGHDWNTQICGSPCAVCGEKQEPNISCIGGDEPTCYEGQYCKVCYTLLKEPLGCDYSDATCTESPICSRCGLTGGYPLGHTWGETTCLEPTRCTVCGEIVQEAQGHSFNQDGNCYDCGAEFHCDCIIDSSSKQYLSPYDEYYEGDMEKDGRGIVVLKESLSGKGKVVLWAKVYRYGEEDPEYVESLCFFDEKTNSFPMQVEPFWEDERTVIKVVYGIKLGW